MAAVARLHHCEACRQSWVSTFSSDQQEQAHVAVELYDDARRALSLMAGHTHIGAIVRLLSAWSDGDNIVVDNDGQSVDLPMLRQQRPDHDGFCWSMADFIRPLETGQVDRIGLFATSVDSMLTDDLVDPLLRQTLCDRLAEAAAERLHEQVRKTLWGYAPDEHLTIDQLHQEHFQGIRPAVGYPSLPDLSINFLLDSLLDFSQIGVTLTESAMMKPHASVSGLMIAHPKSHYFSIGPISDDQLADYARRRQMDATMLQGFVIKE